MKKTTDTPEGKQFRTVSQAMVKVVEEILDGPAQRGLDLCAQYY
jgi:hypothetical protein